MESNHKYALVTGASSGIGWHIAETLAGKGYSVVAVSNQPKQLDNLKKSLEQAYGITVIIFSTDLARENSAQQIFEFCEKHSLTVEVLVNNAGMFIFGEAVTADYSAMRSMLNLHTVTPVLLSRMFGESMISRGNGYIMNISSITAVMPYPGISLYGPTKAFIRHFTRAIRTEMKLYGVKVTCLLPGAVSTAFYGTDKYNTPVFRLLGLMKTPQTVAKAGVNALFKNRPECVPGLLNKIIVFLLPLVPHSIISLINKRTNLVRAKPLQERRTVSGRTL
jgi:short-subunit dehydrogenase